MESFVIDPIEAVLLGVAAALLLVQVVYHLALYNRVWLRHRAVKHGEVHFSQALPPISVIITASDECASLRRNLTSVLEQDYPDFEVIVINDGKGNESENYLKLLANQYPNLYHSFVPDSSRYLNRRKLAVSLGIKASQHEWLLITEASFRPASNQWLRLMARNFTSHTDYVLGYTRYDAPHGRREKQVALRNFFQSLHRLSLALAGFPNIRDAKNLAMRKDASPTATGKNTRVESTHEAALLMQPTASNKLWREGIKEKRNESQACNPINRLLTVSDKITRWLFHPAWLAATALAIAQLHWTTAGIGIGMLLLFVLVKGVVIGLARKALK